MAAAWLALVAILALGAPAFGAQVVSGKGLIVAKNVETGEVELHTGVLLKVTEITKISDERGRRIEIDDLAVASTSGGAVHADPEAMVRWTGRSSSAGVVAYSIQVLGHLTQ